ncbi:PREDICTED: chaperone protein dnaJ 11, chloroplastic-like [Ipomoea nil]|uniref:chaperone protein dnaJ 11, chloroplastic-like n=1 Tax=Ipomoea nil TaxID=35883 RepID=UPI0009009ED7|nr:PREDICTED: chaperone protein dnaJ 11, chloroplastic-like [Ipomoea nil]
MASFSAPYNSLLPSPTQTSFFSSESSASPSSVKFRPSSFPGVAASATATYAEFETETTTASFSSPPKLTSPSPTSSFYDLLGIPVGATSEEIKAAYRRLARACHPDVAGTGQKESSANEFMKIHTAYSTLSDPEKRADYDRRLFRRRRSVKVQHSGICTSSAPEKMSRFTGYTRRNWETDQCW